MQQENRKIFTNSFTGSIDELLEFTQANSDFVSDVTDGNKDFTLTDEESIEFIKIEYKEMYNSELSDEEASKILEHIKIEQTKDTIDELVKHGLVEIKGYNEDGEPLFGLTEEGEKLYPEDI